MHLACSGLFSWIEKNYTIVTPSRVLSTVAYRQFVDAELTHGREIWLRPSILSLGAWLTNCWQDARYRSNDVPTLLSAVQEHTLWKRIIQTESTDLFDTDATARLASRAARTLLEWELPLESPHWNDGSDAPLFHRWFQLFQRACHKEGWTTHADLWARLPKWISQPGCLDISPILLPTSVPPFPALARVLTALRDRALVTSFDAPQSPISPAPAKSFDDLTHEVDFAARWAREALEQDPLESIAVFLPDLAAHRALIHHAFLQVFYPGACRALLDQRLSETLAGPAAFYIHAPTSATSQPLIAGALLLLELARARLPISDAGSILRSPWLPGEARERSLRAVADLELRRRRQLDVSLDDLQSAAAHCPHLSKIWPRLRHILSRRKPLDTFAAWNQFVGDLLQSVGWPGDNELDLAAQQALETWTDALSGLSSLSLVSDSVTFETALAELRRLLNSVPKQPNLRAPVQIFDASQATGLQFDTALLAGLSEELWPPLAPSSPFIPLKLQRQYNVPGSSPQSLRAERQRLTTSLFSVALRVLASWSGRPSPLVDGFVSPNLNSAAKLPMWTGPTPWQSYKPALLEETDDSLAPPFVNRSNTRGGTSIIRAQSLCPFRAFAEFRLQAGSPEEGCLGFDSRERGGNLHKALEFVWQKLHTRDCLRATSIADLEALVEAAATHAVAPDGSSSFGKIVASVEIERLKSVILDWLAIERDRQQNFTVETVEEEKYLDLAGLRLRLRIDRIDRLPNGQLLLIDYKSGEQKRKKLECPRPEEPQLLVYASGLGDQVDGVLFAQLKARDVRPVGFTREKHFKSKTVDVEGSAWDLFLSEARDEVENLAEQFKNGYAALDPLKGACDYCSQKPLCRINENRAGEESEE
jgi:ATP-dependent helicase/nuclease subunit B